MGTGLALYADASQNLPFTRIAIGSSVDLPFAESCSSARARGPASFFLGTLRSPGVICGRSSCAVAPTAINTTLASNASKPQYRILWNTNWLDGAVTGLARLDFDFPGRIRMNIHDKAPDFALPDENGKKMALKDLKGKTVILFFYPRA